MSRRLVLVALVLVAVLPAGVRAQGGPPKETTPPTGTITGSPSVLAKTKTMKLAIRVSADDHGGSGISVIKLYYVHLPGSTEVHIRDFAGADGAQTLTGSMTWITGVRALGIGSYELHAKFYDVQENVSTGTFPFQIKDAGSVAKQKVDLRADPTVTSAGLSLKIHAVVPDGKARGKLRVVVLGRNKKKQWKPVKKYSHGAANPWTLNIALEKGQYRWQAFYDAKAPFVSAHTSLTSFSV